MNTALGDIEIVSRLGADERTLAFDALDGLTRPFKEIPPKHFYDTEGSRLFEAITRLPEYYPTLSERASPSASPQGEPRRSPGRDDGSVRTPESVRRAARRCAKGLTARSTVHAR